MAVALLWKAWSMQIDKSFLYTLFKRERKYGNRLASLYHYEAGIRPIFLKKGNRVNMDTIVISISQQNVAVRISENKIRKYKL